MLSQYDGGLLLGRQVELLKLISPTRNPPEVRTKYRLFSNYHTSGQYYRHVNAGIFTIRVLQRAGEKVWDWPVGWGGMMYGYYWQCIILSSVIILVSRERGYRIINKIIHCIVINIKLKIWFLVTTQHSPIYIYLEKECKTPGTGGSCGYISLSWRKLESDWLACVEGLYWNQIFVFLLLWRMGSESGHPCNL